MSILNKPWAKTALVVIAVIIALKVVVPMLPIPDSLKRYVTI